MCKKIKLKRYFLPLTGLLGLVWIEEIHNYTYFPLVVGFVSFIFFWNFPYFVYRTISKPLTLPVSLLYGLVTSKVASGSPG